MHRLITTLGLLLVVAGQATSDVVRYYWNITTVDTSLFDGVRGVFAYGINNQPCHLHPIMVTLGDVVEVHVSNLLTERTCMHWHGMKQFGTQEMDGASGITQCQIQPHKTAIYRFMPDKCGSFWYHSHEQVQYAYGLRGAIIVNCPPEKKQSWEEDVYEEYTVLLADWYHNDTGAPPIWNTVLINDVGRYNCTAAEAIGFECGPGPPLPRFEFLPGKKYLFRLINTSALAAFNVSIDEHTFQVVAADGDYLQPSALINSVTIHVAQRYDILVQAKLTPYQNQEQLDQNGTTPLGSFWMRAHSLVGIPWTARLPENVPNGFNPDAFAIIDYQSGATADPTTVSWTAMVTIGEFDFTPVSPAMLPTIPNQRILVEFNLGVLPQDPSRFLGYIALNEGPFRSMVIPDSPPLFTIAGGAKTEDLPVTVNAVKLKFMDQVEVTLISYSPDNHPFHIHGHSPWIVGYGSATRDAIIAGNVKTLRLNDPMTRDVFTVPPATVDSSGNTTEVGYVIFRMTADNPGAWLMHCHIDWHFVIGLSMLFVEAEEVLHEKGLEAFSPNMRLSICGAGNFTL